MPVIRLALIALIALIGLAGCSGHAASGLPGLSPVMTPPPPDQSTANPAVTQATIGTTICQTGWTATVRPPLSYTAPIKAHLIAALPASADHNSADYELDHWLPLEVGGAPSDPANLVLQPIDQARAKDQLETAVKVNVCAGLLTLAEGRAVFAHLRRP